MCARACVCARVCACVCARRQCERETLSVRGGAASAYCFVVRASQGRRSVPPSRLYTSQPCFNHDHCPLTQSELNDWGRNPPDGCCLESCEPMTQWVVIMAGPEGAGGMRLYEGEVFRCVVLGGCERGCGWLHTCAALYGIAAGAGAADRQQGAEVQCPCLLACSHTQAACELH